MKSWIVRFCAAWTLATVTAGFAVAGTPGYLMRYDVLGLADDAMHSANAVATLPDGSVVTVGVLAQAPKANIVVAKLGPDGQPDMAFGKKGGAVIEHLQPQSATAVVAQPDGRLLLGGWSGRGADRNFLVARLLPDGSLDPDFGRGGMVEHPVSNDADLVNDIALQPDGRILAVGGARMDNGSDQIAVLRLMPDGQLDQAFGKRGVRLLALDVAAAANPCRGLCGGASSVAVMSDGRILLGAETAPVDGTSVWRSWVVRLQADGSLDSQFGMDGKVEVFTSRDDLTGSTHIVLQGSRVVAGGGYNVSAPEGRFALTRLTPEGLTDRSFGHGGFARTQVGPHGSAAGIMALAVTDDMRLLAAGVADFGEDRGGLQFVVARYTADGALDDRFAEGGLLAGGYAPGNGTDALLALAPVAGSEFVAAGWTQVASGARGLRMGVARYRETAYPLATGIMAGAGTQAAQTHLTGMAP